VAATVTAKSKPYASLLLCLSYDGERDRFPASD